MNEKQGAFLRRLRIENQYTLQRLADLLREHGYSVTKGRLAQLEQGSPLTSAGQLAYCRAFDLDDNLRLHLQRLAGEAAGCRCLPTTEAA